jgi:hypothetical protein
MNAWPSRGRPTLSARRRRRISGAASVSMNSAKSGKRARIGNDAAMPSSVTQKSLCPSIAMLRRLIRQIGNDEATQRAHAEVIARQSLVQLVG